MLCDLTRFSRAVVADLRSACLVFHWVLVVLVWSQRDPNSYPNAQRDEPQLKTTSAADRKEREQVGWQTVERKTPAPTKAIDVAKRPRGPADCFAGHPAASDGGGA